MTEIQKNEENCKIYLCGTKLDVVKEDSHWRQVDYHDLNDYAEEVRSNVVVVVLTRLNLLI